MEVKYLDFIFSQSTYIPREPPQCLSPRWNWDPPPLPQASVPLPPEPGGGGGVHTACEGVGESLFERLERKLSTLPTLWVAQLRARLLRQHSEFNFRHRSKIINERHKQRSGQQNLAHKKA
jgi:hypothetical protein